MLRYSTQRILLLLSLVFSFILFITWFRDPYTATRRPPNFQGGFNLPGVGTTEVAQAACPTFPNEEGVQIIVKTGANEINKKLPTQLLTSLRCFDKEQILFFSDLKMKIGSYQIHDVLADVDESVKQSTTFAYYRELQDAQSKGEDLSTVKIEGNAAWNLDKFKFLHMLEKTWKMKPGKEWYIFIEADTYLLRSNLHLMLRRFSPKDLLYIGSAAFFGGDGFAHGGSGYILSGAALRQYADGNEGQAAAFDVQMKDEQYGDVALMKALKERGIELTGRWPVIQGETQYTIPFGPKQWCHPVVTMHHMSSEESKELWQYEQARPNQKKPFLAREVFEKMIESRIEASRDEWDNHADDTKFRKPGEEGDRQKDVEKMSEVEKEAYLSFDHCKRACEEEKKCFQFLYKTSTKECAFGSSFRLGVSHKTDTARDWQSGWNLQRIKEFKRKHPCWWAEWDG